MPEFFGSVASKSDNTAIKYRESGNAEFRRKNYLNALISYNISISYACTKKVLSLGYANRSAVYIEIESYEACLKNIQWARENDYPMDKIEKLNEREQKCKRFILEGKKNLVEDPWDFFKLSYPPNKKIPWIVDRLELRKTKKYGRGIYATKDLKVGDIICVEDSIFGLLDGDSYYMYCNNCLKTSKMNLLPCNQTGKIKFKFKSCLILIQFSSNSFDDVLFN